MSTPTFEEGRHPRAQAGRFAAKPVDDAAGGLAALTAVPDTTLPEPGPYASAASERATALWSIRAEAQARESAHSSAGLGALVRQKFLTADTVDLGLCELDICAVLHARGARDAGGTLLGPLDPDSAVMDFEVGLNAHGPRTGSYLSPGPGRTAVVHIDAAIAEAQSLATPEPTRRASGLIDGYRALHQNMTASPAAVASAVLSDLRQWAGANGLDFEALAAGKR